MRSPLLRFYISSFCSFEEKLELSHLGTLFDRSGSKGIRNSDDISIANSTNCYFNLCLPPKITIIFQTLIRLSNRNYAIFFQSCYGGRENAKKFK